MMKAGTYYVGDLCYVLHDVWNEVCDIIFASNDMCEGEHALKDGRKFAVYSTRWGDGTYKDEQGRKYPVDAGIIGCILSADVKPMSDDWWTNDTDHGNVIEFTEDFYTSSYDGVLHFGHVTIDTSNDEWDFDSEPDVDEAQEWHDYDPDC